MCMKTYQDQLTTQLQTLLTTLQALEDQEPETPDRWNKSIGLCNDSLRTLRQTVEAQGFPDQDTEVFYFKKIKPAVEGRFTYCKRVYQLQLNELKSTQLEKERLRRELDAASQVLAQQESFWRYCQSGSQSLDEQYFVRGKEDWALQPWHTSFDERFSTSGDQQLAQLIATELFMEYVDRRIKQQSDPASGDNRRPPGPPMRCNASATEMVELIYALHAAGVFPGSIRELIQAFENSFQIRLPNYHVTFGQIKARKTEFTRFLNKLVTALEFYIKQLT